VTLWRINLTSQRPTLRGESAMPFNGRPADSEAVEHKPGRWRR
jgi:hypothetical protein